VKLPSAQALGAVLVALATPFVVVAVAVMLFLNPIWVGFDQDRTDVARLTGYSPTEVRQVTGSILSDLVFGPPNFDVSVDGTTPVLDAGERGHMADVRTVLMSLGLVALVSALILIAAGVASRGRRWFWHGVELGGKLLVGGVAVVGLAFAVFFEKAFELFHELFFKPGTYSFDPAKEKLVQLFPDQFWSETSVAIAAAVLVLAVVVVFGAGRIAGRSPVPALASDTGPADAGPSDAKSSDAPPSAAAPSDVPE
jgi:integral membrane protein (TIGR01906 family)